jgi:hypothetical protein
MVVNNERPAKTITVLRSLTRLSVVAIIYFIYDLLTIMGLKECELSIGDDSIELISLTWYQ